ncbi:hypothetical protein DL768_005275 [Monosporascus sp. mg162]|nr:hypothetical protein DL768_005275 [Monosporascus sp. mg162]
MRPISKSRFWGLELLDADLGSKELTLGVIGHGGPILIYQIGERETRILIDVPEPVYEASLRIGGIREHIRQNVIPTLPCSIRASVEKALDESRLRSMPNTWLPPSTNRTAGAILLGGAMNMRHPLTGGGMTVGLNDVVVLQDLLGPRKIPDLKDDTAVLRQMRMFHWKRKHLNAPLNILAQALYLLFVADDPQLQVLRQGFIEYIKQGNNHVEEPSGLMGVSESCSETLMQDTNDNNAGSSGDGLVAAKLSFLPPILHAANKPQNVDEPTVIKVSWSLADLLLEAGEMAKDPYVDTPMDFVEKPAWEGWKRRSSLLHYGGLERRPLVRIPNDYSPPPPTRKDALFVWVISAIHAGIHLIGWNFPFSTYTEVLIWRISSLVLLVAMAIGGLVPVLSTRKWFDFSFNLLWIWVLDAQNPTWARKHLFNIVVDFSYFVYILARILIFVEVFAAFRSLPADAYDEISWTAILPHV